MKRWARLFAFLLIGCLLFSGCNGCSSAPPAPANTLVYGRGADADFLDPVNIDNGESVKVIINIFDTLIAYHDETIDLVGSLATKWETSDDGLKWTFHLREGVKFHDGTTLDAEAVVFSFNRIIQKDHPHVSENQIPYRPDYAMIRSVRAEDPLTVVFELKEPSAVFEANIAMFPASIVSPTAVKKLGEKFNEHPVGSGPFQFDSWQRDQELRLKAFDDYWNGRPKVDRVIFVPIEEPAVLALKLEQGEVHIADNLPPLELNEIAKNPDIEIQKQRGANLAYLTMQTSEPPLDNVKVRHAIWHAIDKQKLIEIVYAGQAQVAVNPLPPTIFGWNDKIRDREFNPAKAQQLLREAQKESDFEIPLKLSLFVMKKRRPYMQQPAETAIFIKQSLEKIGIDAEIRTSPNSQHFQKLSRGEHQLGLIGWSADKFDPDNFLYTFFSPENINDLGGNNTSRYKNPEVQKLLVEAQKQTDLKLRKALYYKIQEILFADSPVVPLVHTAERIAIRKEVKGYKLHPSVKKRLRKAYFEGPSR